MEKCNKKTRKGSSHGYPDRREKVIFLDIACCFEDDNREHVIKFLEDKGYHTNIGLSVLVEKGLIIESNNKMTMHNLVQEMGREII